MATSLERRFLEFLNSVSGSESLDSLLAGSEFEGERRADFLLYDRKVVLEVKSLETDTSSKVDAEVDHLRERDDFPVMYGQVELREMLKHLADGDDVNNRIFLRVSRSVESATRSAEKQIENTAQLLDLVESVGVLVMLNETVDILAPDVVVARIARLMHRKSEDGCSRSPIDFAWLLFEGHTVTSGPAERTLPMVVLEGPRASKFAWFSERLTDLQKKWAQFNGHPLIVDDAATLGDMEIVPLSSQNRPEPGDKMTRQQLRELHYSRRPYLRNLSDQEVFRYGRLAFHRLAPYFWVGGPKGNHQEMEPMIAAWSDFLSEARYRGLDLRLMLESASPTE